MSGRVAGAAAIALRLVTGVLAAWWFRDAWFQDGEAFTRGWRLLTLGLLLVSTTTNGIGAEHRRRRADRRAPAA